MIVHLYFSHSIIHCFYDISGLSQNLPAASPHSDITHDTKGNFTQCKHIILGVYILSLYSILKSIMGNCLAYYMLK